MYLVSEVVTSHQGLPVKVLYAFHLCPVGSAWPGYSNVPVVF